MFQRNRRSKGHPRILDESHVLRNVPTSSWDWPHSAAAGRVGVGNAVSLFGTFTLWSSTLSLTQVDAPSKSEYSNVQNTKNQQCDEVPGVTGSTVLLFRWLGNYRKARSGTEARGAGLGQSRKWGSSPCTQNVLCWPFCNRWAEPHCPLLLGNHGQCPHCTVKRPARYCPLLAVCTCFLFRISVPSFQSTQWAAF